MRRGKEIAQGTHASLANIDNILKGNNYQLFLFSVLTTTFSIFLLIFSILSQSLVVLLALILLIVSLYFASKSIDTSFSNYYKWMKSGSTKITLIVNSEKELIDIYNKAKKVGLNASIITDSGRTEFKGIKTKTAVGIGPNNSKDIDKITGNLRLY